VLDEFTHECLAIRVARKLKAIDVIDVLSDLFILRGVPAHIRSDNGPEFVAKAVQEWIAAVGAKTAYIERGSPWENGYIESFNARRVAGCTTPTGSAGHAGATANLKLTFHPDHSAGADQLSDAARLARQWRPTNLAIHSNAPMMVNTPRGRTKGTSLWRL
jgi:transposase InsO family protein